jgi:phosphate transport system protein
MTSEGANVIAGGWLLFAIHHVERMADHALNISERVTFMVTGESPARKDV